MNTLKKWSFLGFALVLVSIFLPTPSLADVPTQHYTVAKGDCLWTIAAGMLGDPFKWPLIYEANRDRITDPDVIQAGWHLTVPASPTATQVAEAVAYARQYGETSAALPAETSPPPAVPAPAPLPAKLVLGLVLLLVVLLLTMITLGIQRLVDQEEATLKNMPPPVPITIGPPAQPETVVAKPAEVVTVPEASPDPAVQPTESEAIVRAEQGPDPHTTDTHQHAA